MRARTESARLGHAALSPRHPTTNLCPQELSHPFWLFGCAPRIRRRAHSGARIPSRSSLFDANLFPFPGPKPGWRPSVEISAGSETRAERRPAPSERKLAGQISGLVAAAIRAGDVGAGKDSCGEGCEKGFSHQRAGRPSVEILAGSETRAERRPAPSACGSLRARYLGSSRL